MTWIRLAVITVLTITHAGCGGKSETTGSESGSETTTDGTTSDPTTTTTTATTTTDSDTAGPTGSETDSTSDTTDATTEDTTDGTTDPTDPSTTDPSTTDPSTTDTDTGGGECIEKECGGKLYECGDCIDNDNDGLVDAADPECLSPCDDDESYFATGLPGDNMDPCNQDCFFDGNSGSGDDKCQWNLKCDPENPGGDDCPYDPNFNNCPEEQMQTCLEECAVPNGCDCFGCCTVTFEGMDYDIYIGDPDCSLANLDLCQPCTKNFDCDDDCEPELCEVCFGQDPEDLPPECDEPECGEENLPCMVDNMGGDNCPDGQYCANGCCFIIPG